LGNFFGAANSELNNSAQKKGVPAKKKGVPAKKKGVPAQ